MQMALSTEPFPLQGGLAHAPIPAHEKSAGMCNCTEHSSASG